LQKRPRVKTKGETTRGSQKKRGAPTVKGTIKILKKKSLS